MPNEPEWLPVEAVVEINRAVVAITAESHFVRDPGLLESALARPRNALAYGEDDLAALAVRLIAGIAQAHAFEQGNKRTAFVAMVQFLNINSRDLVIEDREEWADRIIAFVEHRSTEEEFVQAIRPLVVEFGGNQP
ncbi:MAG TPA: type II toxin-antitoxin system death-on-curing family toxin [Stellaceae bacterium]|nr:type II toxin-antitoxin system death-on-curing family toxin [Stellaceae bacterium]